MAEPFVERVFRDPIHGLITFDRPERALLSLVDTGAFQRLRRLYQNGVGFLTYPGLEKSRFGHSLGAYHVGKELIHALQRRQTNDMGAYSLQEPSAMAFKAACLLHDIGHTCFSHVGERLFKSARKHESWTQRIVRDDPEIQEVLGKCPWTEDLYALLAGSHPLEYLQSFLSGNLDIDRFDYLRRDAQAAGVDYGNVDVAWLLRCVDVDFFQRGWGGGTWGVVFDAEKSVFPIESFLLARRNMYTQVYFHKTTRAAEALLLSILLRAQDLRRYTNSGPSTVALLPVVFERLALGETVTVPEFLQVDDIHVLRCIKEWAESDEDPILRDLSQRFMTRRLFKSILIAEEMQPVLTSSKGEIDELVEARLGAELRQSSLVEGRRLADYYVSVDRCERIIYDSSRSLFVRTRHPEGGYRYFPFEAEPTVGPKFTQVGSAHSVQRKYLIVANEARKCVADNLLKRS